MLIIKETRHNILIFQLWQGFLKEEENKWCLHLLGHQLISTILFVGGGGGGAGLRLGMGQGPGRVGGKGFQEALNHSGWCGWKGKQFAAVHSVRIWGRWARGQRWKWEGRWCIRPGLGIMWVLESSLPGREPGWAELAKYTQATTTPVWGAGQILRELMLLCVWSLGT